MSGKSETGTLPTPKAILFDWDGTLVDTHPALAAAMNEARKAFGKKPWTFEQWSDWLGKSARDAFPGVFGDDWEEARRIYLYAYGQYHLDRLALKPGATDLMQSLAGLSLYLGVVSNKTGTLLRREVTHLGWDGYFGHVIGAGDSDRDKPAPDPVYDVLAPGGPEAGPEVWLIGDNDVDVACGRSANCTTILVGEGYPGVQPDCRLGNLKGVQTVVHQILGQP